MADGSDVQDEKKKWCAGVAIPVEKKQATILRPMCIKRRWHFDLEAFVEAHIQNVTISCSFARHSLSGAKTPKSCYEDHLRVHAQR